MVFVRGGEPRLKFPAPTRPSRFRLAAPIDHNAVPRFDAYTRLDPFYKDIVLYFLAEAQISLGQFNQAITALKQRLERNPNSETSYALPSGARAVRLHLQFASPPRNRLFSISCPRDGAEVSTIRFLLAASMPIGGPHSLNFFFRS